MPMNARFVADVPPRRAARRARRSVCDNVTKEHGRINLRAGEGNAVAIQNSLELEAVLIRIVLKLDKAVQERGTWPVVEEARRTIDQMRAVTKHSAKLKGMRDKLRSAAETIISEINDGALHEDCWDIEDYVDYHT